MGRAEMRRAAKKAEKSKTATYNLTQAQLDDIIHRAIENKAIEIKNEVLDEAINAAMILMLALPMEVLMDHYWTKTYSKKIPEFTEHVLDYYRMWQDGEIKMEDLKKDLWEHGGIRLEEER